MVNPLSEIVQSTNPDLNKAVVRVNIFKEHRQTIQYILPEDSQKLGQAELVVIDEAAAIPLPLVRQLIGPYLVFIASTINGYEGTGRSLSLKLIQQLREQKSSIESASSSEAVSAGGFFFLLCYFPIMDFSSTFYMIVSYSTVGKWKYERNEEQTELFTSKVAV